MYKGKSRFAQRNAKSARSLSGYSKKRKLKGGTTLVDSGEFVAGTVYVKKLTPLLRHFLTSGCSSVEIAQELILRSISTPSGQAWTAASVVELLTVVKIKRSKTVAPPRIALLDPEGGGSGLAVAADDDADLKKWRNAVKSASKAMSKSAAKRELGLANTALTAKGGPDAAVFKSVRRWR